MTVTWVLERDVFSEDCFNEMVEHFKQNDIPYHIVRVIPFVHEIEGKVPDISGPCVVYGSIGTQKLAVKHGWAPGVWTSDALNETALCEKLGELYLNNDAVAVPMSEVLASMNDTSHPKYNEVRNIIDTSLEKYGEDIFFVKPNTDSKEFAGLIQEASKFSEWSEQLLSIGYLENDDFEVVISSPKRVGVEWRMVMCNGKVIAGSMYKNYQKCYQKEGVRDDVRAFAEEVASVYAPMDVFVLDVVECDDGLKVIEANTFNSAGLYKCNISDIITSINNFIER